jgi:hypothetical protein
LQITFRLQTQKLSTIFGSGVGKLFAKMFSSYGTTARYHRAAQI